jgi:hypothetical protein
MNKFISLADTRYRLIGLSLSLTGIILFIVLQCLGYRYEGNWETRIFMINHYVILFGLIMLTYSKEKRDDERVQRIRYTVLKLTYVWTIIGVSVYMVVSTLDRVQFNMYWIAYIMEGVLLLYQILFRIFLSTNPEWIFRESMPVRRSFLMLFVCLVFLIGWIIFSVVQFRIM